MKWLIRTGIILAVAALVGLGTWGVLQFVDFGMPEGGPPNMAMMESNATAIDGTATDGTATDGTATDGTTAEGTVSRSEMQRPARPEGGGHGDGERGGMGLMGLLSTFVKMAAVIAVVALVTGLAANLLNRRRKAQKLSPKIALNA